MANDVTNTQSVATPPAAAAGAPAAAAPVTAENLALRYNYSQLSPQYKQMADRITAIAIAYPDIVKLADPKKQQDMIERIANSKSGQEVSTALGELGDQGKAAWAYLRQMDPTGLLSTAQSTAEGAETLAGLAGAAGQGSAIAFSPLTVSGAGVVEFFNQSKVLWNGMTPEKAQLIGTRFTSSFQARTTEREQDGFVKTAFGSVGNAWSVFKALLATAVSFAAALPGVGQWIAKTFDVVPGRTFAEHMDRQFAEADIKVAGQEMHKLGTRDGVDYAAWGSALTEKGTVLQNRAGQDVNVAAPNADNRTPTLPGAQKDAKGDPIVAPPSASSVLADAGNKGSAAAGDKAKGIFSYIDTPGKAVVAGAATTAVSGITAQFGRGTVEGVARQGVTGGFSAATAAEKAHDNAKDAVKALEKQIAKLGTAEPSLATQARDMLRSDAGKAAAESRRAAADVEKLIKLREALKAAQETEKLAATKAETAFNAAMQGAESKSSRAAMALKDIESGSKWKTVFVDSWRHAGRKLGDGIGFVKNGVSLLQAREAEIIAQVVKDDVKLLKTLPAAATELSKATVSAMTQPVGFMASAGRAFTTWGAPVMIAWDGLKANFSHDERGMQTSSAAAWTMIAGVGGTGLATVGLVAAGAIAATAAAPIVIGGVALTGLAAVGSSYLSGKNYDADHAQSATPATQATPAASVPQAAVSKPAPFTSEQLSAANEGVVEQARMAMAPGRMGTTKEGLSNFNLVGVSNSSVKLGGLIPSMPASTGGTTAPTGTRVASASRPVIA